VYVPSADEVPIMLREMNRLNKEAVAKNVPQPYEIGAISIIKIAERAGSSNRQEWTLEGEKRVLEQVQVEK
jgi:hypothetical protein